MISKPTSGVARVYAPSETLQVLAYAWPTPGLRLAYAGSCSLIRPRRFPPCSLCRLSGRRRLARFMAPAC